MAIPRSTARSVNSGISIEVGTNGWCRWLAERSLVYRSAAKTVNGTAGSVEAELKLAGYRLLSWILVEE